MSEHILKQIDEKLKAVDPEEVEVELDDIKFSRITDDIRKRLEKVEDIGILTLNGCGLESLDNLPKLNKLIKLELFSNKFPGSDIQKIVAQCPNLQVLNIGENNISDFSEISSLSKLTELLLLDLSNTPLSQKDNYRDEVFKLLPQLEALDEMDKEGNPYEVEDDEEELDDEEGEDGDYDEEDELDEDEMEDEDDDEEEVEQKSSKKKKLKK